MREAYTAEDVRVILRPILKALRAWRGINLPVDREVEAWKIYWRHAPELTSARALFSEAEGGALCELKGDEGGEL